MYSVMINLQNHLVYLLQDKNNQQKRRFQQDARINMYNTCTIHVQVHSEILVIHHLARTNNYYYHVITELHVYLSRAFQQ